MQRLALHRPDPVREPRHGVVRRRDFGRDGGDDDRDVERATAEVEQCADAPFVQQGVTARPSAFGGSVRIGITLMPFHA